MQNNQSHLDQCFWDQKDHLGFRLSQRGCSNYFFGGRRGIPVYPKCILVCQRLNTQRMLGSRNGFAACLISILFFYLSALVSCWLAEGGTLSPVGKYFLEDDLADLGQKDLGSCSKDTQQSDAMFSAERVCSIGREADCKSNVGRAWKGLVPGSHGQDWTLQPCPASNFRKDVRAFAEKLGPV